MHRFFLSGKPNKILLIWLFLHLILGWVFVCRNGEVMYLILATLFIAGGCVIFINFRSLWIKTEKFHKYFLLISLMSFSKYLYTDFSLPYLFMQMTTVIILSALYLNPSLIWSVVFVYVGYFTLFEMEELLLRTDVNMLIFSIIFLVIVALSLHKICLISRENNKLIRKLERENNYEQMGQQQHLATIGQIAASIAHDIRNPLTSIQGFVQLIERNEKRANFQEYYQIIRTEIARIDTLLREVLMLSKSHTVDAESWELVHLDQLMGRLTVLMQPEAIKCNIQIRLHIKDNPMVMGSEEKLQQVFMNLLRNAFEAVSSHGSINIILSEEEGTAVIRIQDSGPGIQEETLEQLFTPFYTTKSEGTGLGLSICQSIIKAYEGKIEVRNLPGRGAEFTIMLPI